SAGREELISKNVATMIRLPVRRQRKGKAWSSDEARAFLESVRNEDNALYAAYVLILVLGLRKGEVLGLTWDDVDLDAAELTIGRQLQRVRGKLLHRETKTRASDATLPLPPVCVAALQQRQARQDRARATAGPAWTHSGLVFTTRYGDPIEPRNFNRYFAARCAVAGVRQITVHDARRTCATLLVDLDVHPRIVMQILRHAVRRDDGGVRVGVVRGDSGGAQTAGGEPRWLRRAAVLRSCTGRSGRRNKTGAREHGLLTCEFRLSGWRDSNPRPLRPEATKAPG
ncbi:MAG TPA: site-specific integrase, partial [Pseudonocardiaceae bacterium]|nr:site-specific integrase [Pseudonocardiaceae bacterium]